MLCTRDSTGKDNRSEAERISKGFKSAEEERILDIEAGKPIRLTYKVSVPTEKYPNFNYVGRILGPKGSTLKGMQEISGCKLAVLGKGSMRDKDKEEQCRLEGGKFAHLNEDLHVWIQSFGVPDMAFYKLYVACKEVKKYLHADYNDEIFNEQMMILEQEGGLPKGFTARGSFRGARGSTPRGMMAGRGGNPGRGGMMAMSRGGRGGGMMRGSMGGSMRGRSVGGGMRGSGMRGGRGGMLRGGASGGVSAETLYEDVYEPAPQGFNAGSGGSFDNGLSSGVGGNGTGAGNSYFEEFPEPGGDGMMGSSFQRQNQGAFGGGDNMMNHSMGGRMGMGGGMGQGVSMMGMGQGMNMGMGGMNQGTNMGMGNMGQGMNMGNMGQGMVMGNMGQGMGMAYDDGMMDEETSVSATTMGMSSMKRGADSSVHQTSKFVRRY